MKLHPKLASYSTSVSLLVICVFLSTSPNYAFASKVDIKSCTTISSPGYYQIANNIDASGFDTCILVIADHVVIDIGGYLISGSGPVYEGETAIGGTATQDISIRNGTIANFYKGIALDDTENVTVIDMTFLDTYASGARLGPGATVRNSRFSRASWDDFALVVGGTSIVDGCIFTQNNIAASIGPASLVSKNIVKDSNEDSMNVGANSTVIGNTVTDTYDEGLRVGAYSNIINNNTHGNGAGDLLVDCPSNIVGNSIGLIGGLGSTCNLDDNLVLGEY